MAICATRRLKFIHIPKTGGTSLIKALKLDPVGYHDAWNVYPSETSKFISFTVIRDPVKRFLSQYNFGMSDRTYWHIKGTAHEFADYRVMKDMSLEDIILDLKEPCKERKLKHSGWWPQSWFVCDRQDRPRVHYLLRQERLQPELDQMLSELGHPTVKLESINVSEQRISLANLNEKLIGMLTDLYRSDYDAFGYPLTTTEL
jgi:Sulfotransferase family